MTPVQGEGEGWLECDEQQLAAVRQGIADHSDGDYSDGCGFPARHFNRTSYVFYGGDVRVLAVDRFRGLFVASGEVVGQVEWQVRGGSVTTRPTEAGLARLAE
ncbi:hypothetical protein ABZZ36_25480 [Actinacidiphila glaucinigra]|uniref:hypothetical protein n=1 Tax=Actinacidiphila glaucinigra TaxID=235986 RepID=UPI0033A3ACC3